MATNAWTYKLYDLVTHTFLGTLPFHGVSFSKALNTQGSFSGSINIKDPRVTALDPSTMTIPGKTALYVDLNGTIVWGGIIWTRQFSRSTGTLSIGGQETWSYFAHRIQANDYTVPPTINFGRGAGAPTYWSANPADPVLISAQVVYDALGAFSIGGTTSSGYAGISIQGNGLTPSAAYVSPSLPISQNQTVDQIVTQLSSLPYLTGFDFSLDAAYNSSGLPALTLNFWWPRRGRIAGSTGLTINTSGAMDYDYPEDGTAIGNKIIETGGQGVYQRVAQDAGLISSGGYPLLEKVINKSNVTDPVVLTYMSRYDLALYRLAVATPSVTIPIDYPSMALGDYIVGDDVRWIIDADERFPNGSDSYWRVVSSDVSVPDSGIATQKLTFNTPPST